MSQNQQQTVFLTLQNGKRLRERHVGPLFTSQEEAKRAMEHFIENEHGGVTTEWIEDNDSRLRMVPDQSSSVFVVSEVPVRESFDELLNDQNPPEATA